MNRIKGILYAIVSSSTFGLAPFFTLTLLSFGYSSFEVLTYRWGIASLCLIGFGLLAGCTLAVALAMIFFYHEKKSGWVISAVLLSILGAILLSSGNIAGYNANVTVGIICACISIFSYGGYIIGVRKTRAVAINSTVLTCYVMGLGALFFIIGGCLTEGIRLETQGKVWLYILGLALPATAISNMALVKAIKHIGPTLTSIFGAMEPLTAVFIGIVVFHETSTISGILGMLLIIIAVFIVVVKENRK